MSHHESTPTNRASDASVALVKKAIAALSDGDLDTWGASLADDLEWHEIGRAEPIRGKDALAERFSAPDAQSWSISGETHDVLANNDHAIALLTATATNGDRSLTYKVAEIYHIRDGKIAARWAFSDDTEAINRFFSGS